MKIKKFKKKYKDKMYYESTTYTICAGLVFVYIWMVKVMGRIEIVN